MPKIRLISKDCLEVTGTIAYRRFRQRFSRDRYGDLYKQVAEAKYQELIFETSNVADPNFNEKARNLRRMTVRDLANRYVTEHLSMTRAAGNRSCVARITDKWGSYRLAEITIQKVRPWVYELLNQEYNGRAYSPYSVKKIVVYFRRLFNWGSEMEIIDANPLRHLVDRNLDKAFRRLLKPRKQLIAEPVFWRICTGAPTWVKRAAAASWYTGMREGEVAAMTWTHVHGDVALLDPGDTKEGDHKTIVLPPELLDIMIKIQSDQLVDDPNGVRHGNHIFCGPKGMPMRPSVLSQAWRRAVRNAGLSGLWYHDIRRSWINRMESSGHSTRAIQAQVGHHAARTTDIYRSVPLAEQRSLAVPAPHLANLAKPENQGPADHSTSP